MPPRIWRYITTSLVLLLVLLPLTRQAKRTFPKFDDSHMQLMLKENGPHSLAAAYVFRPLTGWIGQQAINTSHHVALEPVVQFLGWAGFGLLCMWFWNVLFPDKRQYAVITACLVIAPILLKSQLGGWFYVVPEILPVILSFAAGLLLLTYVSRNSSRASIYLAVAAVLTFSGGMLTEYGLLATVCSCILILAHAYAADKPTRNRVFQSLTVLSIPAIAAHLLYVHTADPHPNFVGVSYTPTAQFILHHLPHYISMFFRSFWFATVGATAQTFGTLAEQSETPLSLRIILYSTLVALLLALACRDTSNESKCDTTSDTYSPVRIAALLLALAVSLAPAVLLRPLFVGRDGHVEDMSTRYFSVAAPLAIAVTLRFLFFLVRRRYWLILPVVCGVLCSYAVMEQIHKNAINDHIMFAMGPALRPYVEKSTDQTVVIVPDYYARDYEMMEKVASEWPADLSRRLYVFWEDRFPIVLGHDLPDRASNCADIQFIDRNLATVVRRGRIGNLLWVEPLPKGGFRIEPYCLGHPTTQP